MDPREMETALREALGKDPRFGAERLSVTWLPPDTLALGGEVPTLAAKREASEVAARVLPGVKLENGLTVGLNRPASDAELERSAEEALSRCGVPGGLGVQVRNGVAHLVGIARTLADRDRAEAAVAAVPGVSDLRSDHVALETAQEITPQPGITLRTELNDSDLASAIASRLVEVMGAHADDVRVRCQRGVAMLHGLVRTRAERARAEAAAREVPGVRGVRDELVSLDGAGRDEALEAQIKHAFGRPGDHVSPVDLKVFVVGDTVHLLGQVDFPEQGMQAEAIAKRVPGIHHVRASWVVTERHPRTRGPGHGAEDARKRLTGEGLDWNPGEEGVGPGGGA